MTEHLFLPFPLSVNQMYRSFVRGKRIATIKSEKYREWHKSAMDCLQFQWDEDPITDPIMLTLAIKEPTKHKRDLDNLAKSIQDVLSGVVIKDDSQIKILAMHFDETDSPVGTRVMIDRLSAPIAVNFLKSFENRLETKTEQAERISKSAQPVPNHNAKKERRL